MNLHRAQDVILKISSVRRLYRDVVKQEEETLETGKIDRLKCAKNSRNKVEIVGSRPILMDNKAEFLHLRDISEMVNTCEYFCGIDYVARRKKSKTRERCINKISQTPDNVCFLSDNYYDKLCLKLYSSIE